MTLPDASLTVGGGADIFVVNDFVVKDFDERIVTVVLDIVDRSYAAESYGSILVGLVLLNIPLDVEDLSL